MPRRAVATTAVALALLLTATWVTGTPDDSTAAQAGSARGPAAAASTGSAGTSVLPVHVDERRLPERGRTAFEQRLLDARRDSVTAEPVVGSNDRPNVLVLMLDDMRDDDMRFMPNVQRLVTSQGVRFTNMFSPQPLCCPARASFLSGLYSHNHKVWSHAEPFGFRVFHDDDTAPVWLHDLGYTTTFLGKYLNGYGRQLTRDGVPSARYTPPGWSDWRGSIDSGSEAGGHLSGGTYRYFDTTLSVNGILQPHQGVFQTHLYSKITQDMIRSNARSPQPFFTYISFTTPHGGGPHERDDPEPIRLSKGFQQFKSPARPNYVKGRFNQRITAIPGGDDDARSVAGKPFFIRSRPPLSPPERDAVLEVFRQRVEAISVVDDEIANIMESLKRSGELDNTYVVVTSDNGYFLGEHRMRLGKILPYEPSLRVPLVMRGPGIPAGETRSDPFLMTDFAPTFLDAAGGRPRPDIDGTSMLDVAEHGDVGWTRGILTETGPRAVGHDMVESDNFLIKRAASDPFRVRFSIGVRTPRYLYVDHASGEHELYDLKTDPREFRNVVQDPRYRSVRKLMRREYDQLRDCDGPNCRIPLPPRLRDDDPPHFYVAPARPTAPARKVPAADG